MYDDEPQGKNWSIYIAAKSDPSDRIGKIFLGKKRTHSFLLLVDEDNKEVMRELHGTSCDMETGAVNKVGGRKPLNLASAVASSLNIQPVFMRAVAALGLGNKLSRLAVREVNGRTDFSEIEGYPVVSGSQEQMQAMWEDARKAGVAISEAGVEFISFSRANGGQNCHSATTTVLDQVGLEIIREQFPNYAMPGIDTRIDIVPPEEGVPVGLWEGIDPE